MLVACFLMSLSYVAGQCQNIWSPSHLENNQRLIQCVTGILDEYFSDRKELTYVDMDNDNDEVLKTIHTTHNFSLISRQSTYQSFLPNQGYLVISENVTIFTRYFDYLIMDPTWNPYARFLIVIGSLQEIELRDIFDVLLRQHVTNALVVNGTDDAHLYTYNPFNKFACGRYYSDIISYGLCSQVTQDLYPNKLVTGLKNCTFKALLSNRPPFSIDPSRSDIKKTLMGTEEYILKVLMEKEEFNVVYNYTHEGDVFSEVGPDMKATGFLRLLQTNESEIIFGGMTMIAPRAQAFTYLCGYHDYNDELRFAVKTASLVPVWKNIYIEFEFTVWMLILLCFVVYSAMMIFLLRTKEKSLVMLQLLDNLLLHGRIHHIRCRMTLKYVLIMWVWFAYLINTFYQSSLVSYITNPSKEYQISVERDLKKYDLKACYSPGLKKFIMETRKPRRLLHRVQIDECSTTFRALATVSKDKKMFTLVPNYFYLYNKEMFTDQWGESLIYYFVKPYAKLLFGFYFYKGFPISRRLITNAMWMRENGLAEKIQNDHYFIRRLRQRYSQKGFEPRFTVPWYVYVPGCVLSTVTFLIELLTKYIRVRWSRWF